MSGVETTLDFNISKSSVQVYKIRRNGSSAGWADIAIDENGNKGRLSISSDYGSWAYYWGSCGCLFKQFLCELNISYVARKFGEDRWFDHEATVSLLKDNIIKWRKEYGLSKDVARACFDVAKELEGCKRKEHYEHIYISSELNQFGEGYPDIITDISPRFERFWNTAWKYFVEQLRNESLVEA